MNWKKVVLTLISLTCLLLVLANAGRWLVLDQSPRQADVIIVLSGDSARTRMGIDLYRLVMLLTCCSPARTPDDARGR